MRRAITCSLGFIVAAAVWTQAISDAGQAIYQRGEVALGEGKAYVGADNLAAPLSLFACRNCHGPAGEGKTESALTAPDIRWSRLSKPYGSTNGEGRRRLAYTRESLARAITQGLDSSGKRLHHGMPRYQLPAQALSDLLDYLQSMEQRPSAGVDADYVDIGVLLPVERSSSQHSLAAVIKDLLHAYFDRVNQQGGVYSRRLRLHFIPLFHASMANVVAVLDASFQQQKLIPDTALILSVVGEESHAHQFHFSVFPNLNYEQKLLLDFASHQFSLTTNQVYVPVNSLAYNCVPAPQSAAVVIPPALGADCFSQWLNTWRLLQRPPTLLLHFATARVAALRNYPALVYQLDLTAAQTHSKANGNIYHELAAAYDLPRRHLIAQLMVTATAETLVHALTQSGRAVNPEKLATTMESFYKLDVGFGPPLSFNANRHVGVQEGLLTQVFPQRDNTRSDVSGAAPP